MVENNNTRKPFNRRRSPEKVSYAEKGRFFLIRNILNFIFVILAIAGMITFAYASQAIGGTMLVACVAIKLIECVLRIMH